MIDRVTDGVILGVTVGVTDGVVDGVMDGVTDGVTDGVREDVIDGVNDGVRVGVGVIVCVGVGEDGHSHLSPTIVHEPDCVIVIWGEQSSVGSLLEQTYPEALTCTTRLVVFP